MTNPIHSDSTVQHIDVRIYFDKNEEHEDLLNAISEALQASPDLSGMISAWELVSDGFGRLVPDERPLA